MSRWFNIGGPCNPADHYMLPAVERLPEVLSLIRKKQYFVVHAPRQSGKTTAFQALADEINAKGQMTALYCSVENAQGLDDPVRGLPSVVGQVRAAVDADPRYDYKMRVRPEGQSTGEASPFNVITKAMTISQFSESEMRALYRQHTDETGQVFEEAALAKAWAYSQGQPYLVNALARWCVEEIHHEDFSQPVTGADMEEAKEKLIRERGTHLDSLMEKATDPRVRPMAVDGQSMEPTYGEQGILFSLLTAYRSHPPVRGDVVTIRYGGTRFQLLKRDGETGVWRFTAIRFDPIIRKFA